MFEDDAAECSGKEEPIRETEKATTPKPRRSYAKYVPYEILHIFSNIRTLSFSRGPERTSV